LAGISAVHNEPVPFVYKDSILDIDVSTVFTEGGMKWLLIEYEMVRDTSFYDQYSPFSWELSDSLCHINASITRTDNWYPKVDGTMHDRLAPFRLTIDVPEKFEVMASGRLEDVVTEQGRKTYTWENYEGVTDRSLYFFAQVQSRTVREFPDGFRLILYTSSNARPDNIDLIADVVHKSYRYFETVYGDLPWGEYKIMSFPYGYSGLFNSSNAPSSLFNTEIVHNDIYFPTRSVVHEVSHTWWGNVVSSNADENYWLYESFGKYSEVVGIEPALGADVESLSFFRLKLCTLPYVDYVPSIKNAQNVDDRVLVNVAAYYMGATYLRMLRYVMGEEDFYNGIRHYVQESWGKCIDAEDFFRAMKKFCPKEYREMIVDYVMNPGYARYDIEKTGVKFKSDYYRHSYMISNVGDKDICVPFRVQSDVDNYTKRLFLRVGENLVIEVKCTSGDGDSHIVIDPDEIYPVCLAGLKGPGATVYESKSGEVKAYNIAADRPFASAGITEDMSLIEMEGVALAGNDLRTLNHMLLQRSGEEITFLVGHGEGEPERPGRSRRIPAS
jgi:aminopeptidase N